MGGGCGDEEVGERQGVQEEGACGGVWEGAGVWGHFGRYGGVQGAVRWRVHVEWEGCPGRRGALGEEGICSLVPWQLQAF